MLATIFLDIAIVYNPRSYLQMDLNDLCVWLFAQGLNQSL